MAFFDRFLQPGRTARKPVPQMSVNKPVYGPPAPTMSVAPKPAPIQLKPKTLPQSMPLSTTSYGQNTLKQPSSVFSKPQVVGPSGQAMSSVPQMSVAPKLTLEQMQAKNQALRQSQGRTQGQVQASNGPVVAPKPTPPPSQSYGGQLNPSDPAFIGGRAMEKDTFDYGGSVYRTNPDGSANKVSGNGPDYLSNQTLGTSVPPAPKPEIPQTQDQWLQQLANTNPELADKIMDQLGYSGSPNAPSQIEALRKQYLDSLGLSPEEQQAQAELSGISGTAAQESAKARQEYADRIKAIQDQATLQPFLTGRQLQASGQLTNQLEALQASTEAQTMPLQSRLAALQAQRQMEQKRRETELGFAQKDREAEQVTPVEVGGRLVNPRTGAVVYEPPASAKGETFTLSPGQIVYGADGRIIAQNNGTTDKFTNVSPGSTVIDSAGNVIYKAPKDGEGTDAKAVQAQVGELDTTIGLVDEIVNNPAFNQVFGLSGVTDPRNYLPGSAAQYLKSQIEQLKAFLALENRQKLKGQGTISDREFKVLTDAATALNAKLGDKDALRELTKLRDALTGRRSELSSGGGDSDPDFQALRNDPDLKNYSDAQIRDILGKTKEGSVSGNAQGVKLQSVKIGNKNVVVRKEIAPRLEAAAREFKQATGQDLQVNQDYRSSEHQAELYRKSQRGEIGRAAPPGYSRHEAGLAIDVTNWREAEKFLRKYGFRNDLADDKNHFSVAEFV